MGVSVTTGLRLEWTWLQTSRCFGIVAFFLVEQNYRPLLLISQVEMVSPVRMSLKKSFPLSTFILLLTESKCGGTLCFLKTRLALLTFPRGMLAAVLISCEVTWLGGLTKSLGTQRL